jgi:hypothetical protein
MIKDHKSDVSVEVSPTTVADMGSGDHSGLLSNRIGTVEKNRWMVLIFMVIFNIITGSAVVSYVPTRDNTSVLESNLPHLLLYSVKSLFLFFFFCERLTIWQKKKVLPFVASWVTGPVWGWIISKRGIKWGVRISVVVSAVGSVLRMLGGDDGADQVWLKGIGQFLIGIGSFVPILSPLWISGIWFPVRFRVTATAAMT